MRYTRPKIKTKIATDIQFNRPPSLLQPSQSQQKSTLIKHSKIWSDHKIFGPAMKDEVQTCNFCREATKPSHVCTKIG